MELAVALPLFTALLGGAQLLYRQVERKLELQKATHFATWELTRFVLSDYARGDHGERLREAVAQVRESARREFGVELEVVEGQGVALPRALGDSSGLNSGGRLRIEARSGPFRNRELLAVDGWALPDGSDAVIRDGRAGNRRRGSEPHLLYTQVRRMTFAGASKPATTEVGRLLSAVGLPLPAWAGTFVVAHNYGPARLGEDKCEGLPGYPQDAAAGLNRFADKALDFDRPQCFDTAPFRDTQSYQRSLYIRMFRQRGRYFMGCQRSQVDECEGDQ